MPKVIVDWKTINDFVIDAFKGVGVPAEEAGTGPGQPQSQRNGLHSGQPECLDLYH